MDRTIPWPIQDTCRIPSSTRGTRISTLYRTKLRIPDVITKCRPCTIVARIKWIILVQIYQIWVKTLRENRFLATREDTYQALNRISWPHSSIRILKTHCKCILSRPSIISRYLSPHSKLLTPEDFFIPMFIRTQDRIITKIFQGNILTKVIWTHRHLTNHFRTTRLRLWHRASNIRNIQFNKLWATQASLSSKPNHPTQASRTTKITRTWPRGAAILSLSSRQLPSKSTSSTPVRL